ncbi:TPA: ash family protein [Escherichia coli]|nr:ash family protein [Escherichia coli]HDJ0016254.1 ash family protein [Escherichia coli]
MNSPHSNHTSTQHKNRLPALAWSGYSFPAPHKTGAGFRSPLTNVAHNRASGFFVRTVSPRLFRVRIMAGRTGPTSVGPGSAFAGTANLVRLATHSFAALDGEFSKLTHVEATSWQTASNSAPALSVFTPGLKSTADFSAQHASRKSCISTCCMSARTRCQTVTALLSSAISPKIWQNCKVSSTSTDKPHPEAIPHPCAGGFRTSVTGGSHEER